MKYLAGVLALAALAAAGPEADPALYYAGYGPTPYLYRPYFASGYAGPLPGASYQAVHRLHKREAEADPQLILNAAPYTAVAAAPLAAAHLAAAPLAPFAPAVFPAAGPVINTPVVKSVVEAPASVTHTVHAAPLAYAASPFHYAAAAAPLHYAAAPAPLVHAAPLATSAVVGLDAHDCVTEGGCALRAALHTGLPAATFGTTSVAGRKRREAEADAEAVADADADAEADADAYYYYSNFYGNNPFGYGYGYNRFYNAYAGFAHPYAAFGRYAAYNYAPYAAAPAPVVEAAPLAAAPVVPAAPAVYHAAPVVETVSKPVTYTHLGAHPIAPTTVIETKSHVVGK